MKKPAKRKASPKAAKPKIKRSKQLYKKALKKRTARSKAQRLRPLPKKQISSLQKELTTVVARERETEAEERKIEKEEARLEQKEERIEKTEHEILKAEKRLEHEEKRIEAEEKKLETLEKRELKEENAIKDLSKVNVALEKIELQKIDDISKTQEVIHREMAPKPLTAVTYKDMVKGLIGALVGVLFFFGFVQGSRIAEGLTIARSVTLLVISFIIGFLFIYYSGFRKVKEVRYLKFFPARIFVIYFVSLAVAYIVLLMFGFVNLFDPFVEVFKEVSSVSIVAVIGAGIADLLGKE